MKKKFFSVMTAIIAVLALSLNVFAAGSIVGSIDMPKASADRGSVRLSPVTPGIYDDALQAIVDRLKNIDLGLYKFLSPVMDLQFDGVTPTEDNPVKVTFVANNMTDNIQVDVLYYCPIHGWEVLQGERVSDNEVAAYFHAGSSVVALIYRDKGSAVGTSATVSPQTGARATWPLAGCAAFFIGFGIFAIYKSKKTC